MCIQYLKVKGYHCHHHHLAFITAIITSRKNILFLFFFLSVFSFTPPAPFRSRHSGVNFYPHACARFIHSNYHSPPPSPPRPRPVILLLLRRNNTRTHSHTPRPQRPGLWHDGCSKNMATGPAPAGTKITKSRKIALQTNLFYFYSTWTAKTTDLSKFPGALACRV